jgi:hypothetical protein
VQAHHVAKQNELEEAMHAGTNPMERAYELARSGRYSKIDDLMRTLSAEGFDHVHGHLMGRGTRAHLLKLMAGAKVS